MPTMQLEEVVCWGRSQSEYRRMFDLNDDDLHSATLGCGDGPASFNAEMTALGSTVISTDPLYAFSPDDIRTHFEEIHYTVVDQARIFTLLDLDG